jgi:serine/threonine-protein kinase
MARALARGTQLGPYRLEEAIGEGAVGKLFRATRQDDGQTVALKVLRSELAEEPVYRRRFRREARIAATIRHPNLVEVLGAGEEAGSPYLAARFVDGGSLQELLRAQTLGLDDVVGVAFDVGAGLTALHQQRLVHRDVKPANVMVDLDGRALLTDFGLAKGPALTALTRSGLVLGTPQYLAPELIDGTAEATPASDVYSFACLLFACLAGRPPFTGSLMEVAFAQLEEDPPDPCVERDDAPPAVSEVVLGALSKNPADRPRSPIMLAHLLRAASSSMD